jgi:hypothetical protein
MGIFGGLAITQRDDLNACAPTCDAGRVNDGRTFALVSDIGLGVGVVGVGVGAVLLVLALNESPSSTTEAPVQVSGGFDEHGGYVTASGSF